MNASLIADAFVPRLPFLLAADLWDWARLAFLLLPVLALLYRAVVGDRDEMGMGRNDLEMALERRRQEAAQSVPVEAEIVARPMSSIRSDREFSERVAHDVGAHATGAKIQEEIHKKFEARHVGKLGADEEQAAAEATPQPLVEFSPDQMKQAFLLREILRRPEW